MRGKVQRSGRQICVYFGPGEDDSRDKLIAWLLAHEAPVDDTDHMKSLDDMGVVRASEHPTKCPSCNHTLDCPFCRPDSMGNEQKVFPVWRKWYSTLQERYPDVATPAHPTKVEGALVRQLLSEYGEDRTLEIFKVVVMDWDAFKQEHSKRDLPIIPTLEVVSTFRRELDGAVAKRGVTTSKQRVSDYGGLDAYKQSYGEQKK